MALKILADSGRVDAAFFKTGSLSIHGFESVTQHNELVRKKKRKKNRLASEE